MSEGDSRLLSLSESFICASVQLAHFYARTVHTCHLVNNEEEKKINFYFSKGENRLLSLIVNHSFISFISFICASIQLCPFHHEVCSHIAFSEIQNQFTKETDFSSLGNNLFVL